MTGTLGKEFLIYVAVGALALLLLSCSYPAPATSTGSEVQTRPEAVAPVREPVREPVQAPVREPTISDIAPVQPVASVGLETTVLTDSGLVSTGPFASPEEQSGSVQNQAVQQADGSEGIGIIAAGTGSFRVAPDLATLRLGVEAIDGTVSEARETAATAMTAVIASLEEEGVERSDIQTGYFSIQPRYTGREVTRCIEVDSSGGESSETTPGEQPKSTSEGPVIGGAVSPQMGQECFQEYQSVITGYEVSNDITVVVRDLEKVDDVIDEAARAGGDAIRFGGLSFSLDEVNRESLKEGARVSAVDAMQDRASELAALAGVELGSLVYLTEVGSGAPPVVKAQFALARDGIAESGGTATPIAPGEILVEVNVLGRYLIAYPE